MPYCPFRSCNQQRYFETDEALFQHARTSKRTHPCCVSCERLFVDNEAYMQHKESRHTFHCKKCNLKYRSEESLEQHFRSSKAHPSCALCRIGVYGREALNIHMTTEHPMVDCETCGVEMAKDELEIHYRNSFNHPNCTQCRVGFKNLESYNEHNLALHPDVRCHICDRSFLSVDDLDRHNREPEMHPRCKFCGGVFRHTGALVEHVAAEHFLEEMRASSSSTLPTVLPLESIATIRQKAIAIPSASVISAEPSRLPPFSAVSSRPPSYFGLPLVYQHSTTDQRIESPTEMTLSPLSTPPSSTNCTVTALPASDSEADNVSAVSNHGGESRASPDFSFSFHPTFLDNWQTELAGADVGGPPRDARTTETATAAPPTPVTPSLLAEGLLKAKESPKAPRITLPGDVSHSSPLEPSTSRVKVPLAETPSGDLSDFRLLRGCQTPPREGATTPSSLDSLPRTPKTAPTGVAVVNAETVPETSTMASQLSFHCRICQENPCKEITATTCGHLFCHQCIVEEVRSNARCPVCNAAILLFALLKLDATVRVR